MRRFIDSVTWRITFVVILLVLPLNILTILFIHNVVTDSDERMTLEIQSSLSVSSTYLERELEALDRRLLYENVINSDFSILADLSESASAKERGELIVDAKNIFKQMLDEYQIADLFYCYFPTTDLYITNGSPGISRDRYLSVINELSHTLSDDYGTVWTAVNIDGTPTLISLTRWKNRDFGVLLNLNNTGEALAKEAGSDRYISFVGTDNSIIPVFQPGSIVIDDNNFNESDSNNDVIIDGKDYRLYEHTLEDYNIVILMLVPYTSLFNRLSTEALILSLIALFFTIVALPLMLVIMRKWLIKPIFDVTKVMRRIEDGDIEHRLDENLGSTEFNQISHSFNKMMDEVENLKIDVYEKELEKKDITTTYLSRQIQPHFILNALNILYSYEPEEYELSRKLILSISKYFRYIVNIKKKFVTLKQEMDFVKTYLDIQSVRYPDLFFSIVEYEEELKDYLIPPLIVQTLTENSIKHSLKIGKKINIYVITDHIKGDDGHEKIRIRVYDTGMGITDEILDEIHQFQNNGEPQEHLGVGIQNTIERLKYIYSDMTMISFERDPDGNGTNIELLLPMIKD